MKLKLLTIIALAGSLNAVELRLGNGSFDWNMGITKFMDVSCDLDINTISISEPHGNLSFENSKIYYFFNADIYSSDFVDQMNTKAKELELINTNFVGPTGLRDNNKSTALDVLILAKTAFKPSG